MRPSYFLRAFTGAFLCEGKRDALYDCDFRGKETYAHAAGSEDDQNDTRLAQMVMLFPAEDWAILRRANFYESSVQLPKDLFADQALQM